MNVPPRVSTTQDYTDNEVVTTWECWNLTASYLLNLALVSNSSGGSKFLALDLCLIDSPGLGMVLPWVEFPLPSKLFFMSSSGSIFVSCRTLYPTDYNSQAACIITAYQTAGTGSLFRLFIRQYLINLLQQLG